LKYLQAIGEKKAFKLSEVVPILVPNFEELSTDKLYPKIKRA